jgi:integrase
VLDAQIRTAHRHGQELHAPTMSEKRREQARRSPSSPMPKLEEYFVQPFGDTPSFYERRQSGLARATRKLEADLWDKRIGPTLGQIPIDMIDLPTIEDWRDALVESGIKPRSIERCQKIVSKLLNDATKRGLIRFNPAEALPSPKFKRTPITPLEPVEVERIAQGFPEIDRYMVRILGGTGLRPSELIGTGESDGVRWRDLSDNGRDHLLRVTAGKTGDTRDVRILPPILSDLESLRTIVSGTNDDLIVPGTTGGEWTESEYRNWRTRKWRPARNEANLGNQRIYDLRHGYASLLLHTGRPIHFVARQLGNDPRILSKTYAHILDGLADNSTEMTAEEIILDARKIVQAEADQDNLAKGN